MQYRQAKFPKQFNLVWIRRNLRLDDNRPIMEASRAGLPILLLFIFDREILDELDSKEDLRVNFIHQQLRLMTAELEQYGTSILIEYGHPHEIFTELCQELPIQKIFHAEDFEPKTIRRDQHVKKIATANGIGLKTCLDHVIFHPSDIVKSDLTPYKVYTPYSKLWINSLSSAHLDIEDKRLGEINWLKAKFEQLPLNKIGFENSQHKYPNSKVPKHIIDDYGAQRNFPAQQATSKLGIHLRFGTVSIRKLVSQALKAKDNTFLKQLIWREFFIQIMFHYPSSMTSAFKPKYRDLPWKFSEDHLNRWQDGQTGIPIVDAGMRELNSTGFMHNRVRMITASWLTKNLLHDWRLGERYFASRLFDFELASNVGSWQWVAGTGCDAAPYFRIFNPFTQAKKFDPNQDYIQKWIPELSTSKYPQPMIDYKESRARCLDFYKNNARGN